MSITKNLAWFLAGAAASAAYFLRQHLLQPPSLPVLPAAEAPPSELMNALGEIKDLREQMQWQYQGLITEQEQNFNQIQALLSLYHHISFNAPLPPMKRWAISPDFANLLVTQIRQRHPLLVLEAGGGVSTLIIAYCLREQGVGRVVTLHDNLLEASKIAEQIHLHHLEGYAEVIHAPLQGIEIRGQAWVWYDPEHLQDIAQVDFLVVDGPPQHDNPINMARYPALPLVYPILSENALILLDDAKRYEEKKVIEAWLNEFEVGLVSEFDTEKGAVLLQRETLI